jgi:hypothetical protein
VRYFKLGAAEFLKLRQTLSDKQVAVGIEALCELALSVQGEAAIGGQFFGLSQKEAIQALEAFERLGWCVVKRVPGKTFVLSRHFTGSEPGPNG